MTLKKAKRKLNSHKFGKKLARMPAQKRLDEILRGTHKRNKQTRARENDNENQN